MFTLAEKLGLVPAEEAEAFGSIGRDVSGLVVDPFVSEVEVWVTPLTSGSNSAASFEHAYGRRAGRWHSLEQAGMRLDDQEHSPSGVTAGDAIP